MSHSKEGAIDEGSAQKKFSPLAKCAFFETQSDALKSTILQS